MIRQNLALNRLFLKPINTEKQNIKVVFSTFFVFFISMNVKPIMFLFGLALLWPTIGSSQITGEFDRPDTARSTAEIPKSSIWNTATIWLVRLKLLTPAQLARVFGENTSVQIPETLNTQLELESINFANNSSALSTSAYGRTRQSCRILEL